MKRRKRTGRKPQPRAPAPDVELWRLAEAYLEWMAVTNHSPKTIQNRRAYLDYFFGWCAERGIDDPQQVTPQVLEHYQRHLFRHKKNSGKPLSVREQHARLTAVRGYFKHLTRKHLILYNPAAEIDMPKLPRSLPQVVLSAEEAERVLAAPDIDMPLGLRDRAILEVLYSTGIRRSELLALKIYNVDVERGTLFVHQGKGRKDRLVPIGPRAVQWVEKYLAEVRPLFEMQPDEHYLFVTEHGEAISEGHMTLVVRSYIEAAGVGKPGACHLFRHTMATLMVENGADLRSVQMILGHASLESTQVYTQLSMRHLKNVHALSHPAAANEPRRSDPGDDQDAGDDPSAHG